MSVKTYPEIENVRRSFQADSRDASQGGIAELQTRYLGRKGLLTGLSKRIQDMDAGERPFFGAALNQLKCEIQDALELLSREGASAATDADVSLDVTLPGRRGDAGSLHPLTLVQNQLVSLFNRLGFHVVEGPEVETDYFNFTALNIAADHPSRDMHDTFYFDASRLLRTHTSPVQIRVMQSGNPPFRIIAPGKVYRCDSDMTHSPMFHQIEGLSLGRDIHFGHLKDILNRTLKTLFDSETRLRFRPSYFPFTEPSAEVDISCTACRGEGCRVCSQTGWLEILGAGMVDPFVLREAGLDPDTVSGYAFGMGIERIAMLKYGIRDIRLFYENHLEFLKTFRSDPGDF